MLTRQIGDNSPRHSQNNPGTCPPKSARRFVGLAWRRIAGRSHVVGKYRIEPSTIVVGLAFARGFRNSRVIQGLPLVGNKHGVYRIRAKRRDWRRRSSFHFLRSVEWSVADKRTV